MFLVRFRLEPRRCLPAERCVLAQHAQHIPQCLFGTARLLLQILLNKQPHWRQELHSHTSLHTTVLCLMQGRESSGHMTDS